MKNVWGYEVTFPIDVLYSPELLWVKVNPHNILRLGISDLGVKSVKGLVFLQIKVSKGAKVNKGDKLGEVETTKMVWEIISPISGTVVAVNKLHSSGNPATLAKDPYGEGWLIELEETEKTKKEIKDLMKGDTAETAVWIQEQVEAIIPLKEGS